MRYAAVTPKVLYNYTSTATGCEETGLRAAQLREGHGGID